MPIDHTKLTDHELRRRSKSDDTAERLGAIQEIARRKRELPDANHQVWRWTRRSVIVTAVVGALTIIIMAAALIFRPSPELHPQRQPGISQDSPASQAKDTVAAQAETESNPPSAPKPHHTPGSSPDTSVTYKRSEPKPARMESGGKELIAQPPKRYGTDSTNVSSPSAEPLQPTSEKPTVFEAIPIGKNGLSVSDANSVASTAQSTAADILNCLVTYPSSDGGPCLGVYGAKVTAIRDNLHNQGIELSLLNSEVAKLESQSSTAELRRSAGVLRDLADTIHTAIKSQPTTKDQDVSEPPVVVHPIFVGKNNLSDFEAKSIASTAQRTASEVLNCVVEHKESDGSVCFSVFGTQVAAVRDSLHNDGIEYRTLNDVVSQLESQPSVSVLRHAARVLRAVADNILEVPQEGSSSIAETAPAKITIKFPDVIHIRKGKMRSIAKVAELTASKLEVCTATYRTASVCTDETVYADWGYGSVVEQVNNIRLELGKDSIVIDRLEDAASRFQKGPSMDDLRYTARVLDELSKQLDTKAR